MAIQPIGDIVMYMRAFQEKASQSGCPPLSLVATDDQFIEEALIHFFRAKLKRLGYTVVFLSLEQYSDSSFRGQSDLFGGKEAYIITDTLPNKKAKASPSEKGKKSASNVEELSFQKIEKMMERGDESPLVLFSRGPLIQNISQGLKASRSKPLLFMRQGQKPWEKVDQVVRWSEQYVKPYSLDRQVVETLYETCSADFHAIQQEFDKLASYCQGRAKITMQDVLDVCHVRTSSSFIKLYDALLERSKEGVIRELKAIESEEDVYPIALLRFIKQQTTLFIDVLSLGKPLPYKSKAYEKRLMCAKAIGVLSLEQWKASCTHYEIALRSGEESDELPSALSTFLLNLLFSIS